MIDESLDVKEVIYSAERVSVMHADDLVSTAPSSGLSGELQRKPALGLDSHTLYQTASSYCDPPFSFLFFCSVHVYA